MKYFFFKSALIITLIIMSGKLKSINNGKLKTKRQGSANLAIYRQQKKAKAIEDIIVSTPTPIIESRTVCFSCGSKDGVEVSHLCTTNLTPVSEIEFGRDSMKTNEYQYVLSMLDDDVVHEFVSYIVSRELLSPRKTPITVEEIQHELSHTNMKSIIRKLVKERKKDVLEANKDRKTGKELNNVIKNLKMQVRYYDSKECETSVNSEHAQLMSNADLGLSFVIADTTFGPDEVDKYLLDTLNVPARSDDSKATAQSRHLMYVLVLYCEKCYPKMNMSMKSGYSKKTIRSTTSSSDDLKMSLQNLFMMVAEHLPNVQDKANQGIIYHAVDV